MDPTIPPPPPPVETLSVEKTTDADWDNFEHDLNDLRENISQTNIRRGLKEIVHRVWCQKFQQLCERLHELRFPSEVTDDDDLQLRGTG